MAEIIASGDWWTFDSDGLLDIFIGGNMPNYTSANNVPWSNRVGSVRTVTIRDSVTSIGTYAFISSTGLTSVTMPESLTNIGDYAFHNCSALTGITIPESVTTISNNAFNECNALEDVYYAGTEAMWNEISIN